MDAANRTGAHAIRLPGQQAEVTIGARTLQPVVDGPGGTSEFAYRDVDRLVHSAIATTTFGISPISLHQAWQDWLLHLAIAPGKWSAIAKQAVNWPALMAIPGYSGRGPISTRTDPVRKDRRFSGPGWQSEPFRAYRDSFLLAERWWSDMTVGVPGVSRQHERMVQFYARQLLDILAPSNFPLTNPDVLNRTLALGGANLVAGAANLMTDLCTAAGLSKLRKPAFQPGVNVAVTPGEIVYRDARLELIRYSAAREEVAAEPVLIVPAWIMKYYILDLSPHNSLIRFLVDKGFEVFCISWRNPAGDQRDWTIGTYLTGVMAALDVASGGDSKVHAVGYCLGGTLLTIAAAAMARDGDSRLLTMTLLAALVDFTEPGEVGLFIDESQVSMIEDMMWSLGYLDQRQMSGAFQMLRSRDLLWSRVVRDYLMGDRTPISDLMAWNADATRMPYRMHSQYLRSLYIANDLAGGRFKAGNRTVHIEDIQCPVFAVGTTTDHVAPWRSVFKLTHLLDTDIDFVLTDGGHNTGIVSEPGHAGRAYRRLTHSRGSLHPDPDDWLEQTGPHKGSWWPVWATWLHERSNGVVASSQRQFASLSAAPGTYVLER